MLVLSEFSPRAWGWPVLGPLLGKGVDVFPTHVGMSRSGTLRGPWGQCSPHPRGDDPYIFHAVDPNIAFPHACGDGPMIDARAQAFQLISPHAWGWPVVAERHAAGEQDVPTRVGMARNLPTGVSVSD